MSFKRNKREIIFLNEKFCLNLFKQKIKIQQKSPKI